MADAPKIRFIPKRGLADNLRKVGLEEGLFIISLDDRKIYTDATVDGILQRVPLGGDLTTDYITWDFIKEKPFSVLASNDFTVTEDELYVNDNLKFPNKETLDKVAETDDNDLVFTTYPFLLRSYNVNFFETPSSNDIDEAITELWLGGGGS